MNISTKNHSLIAGGAITLISLFLFTASAFLDPEPYHDGSQLPPAIASANGLNIHSDVFSAYGTFTPWIHGFAVNTLGANLLSIRIFTAFITAFATLLLFILAFQVTRSTAIASGVSLVWVATWPGRAVIWGTPFLPWPSNIFIVWQILAILLTLRALTSQKHRKLMLSGAGAATSLAVLTRLNYGAALAIALLVTALIFHKRVQWKASDWGVLAISSSIVFLTPLGILATQGTFVPFVDQSILGPLEGNAIVEGTEWFYIENGYLWGSLLLILTLAALWVLGSWHAIPKKWFVVITITAIIGLSLWASSAIEGTALRELILSRLTWQPALDIQAMQPLYFMAILTMATLFSLVLIGLMRLIKRGNNSDSSALTNRKQLLIVLLTTTGAASLVQLYPVADPNHLWWAAPVPLVLLVFMLSQIENSRVRVALLSATLLPPLVIAPATAWTYFSQPRTQLAAGVVSGMWVQDRYINGFLEADRVLTGIESRSAEFQCKEGLFSVWDGNYLASTPAYVDYAYGLDSANFAAEPSTLILCLPWGSEDLVKKIAADRNFTIVDSTTEISLSYFSDIQIFRLERSSE